MGVVPEICKHLFNNDGLGSTIRGVIQQNKRYDWDDPTDTSVYTLTLSVDKDGDDSNDGILAPVLTIGRLLELLNRIDVSGQKVVIELGQGTWNEMILLPPSLIGAIDVTINGQGNNTIIDRSGITNGTGIYINFIPLCYIKNLKIINCNRAIQCTDHTLTYISNITIESCTVGIVSQAGAAAVLDTNNIFKGNFSTGLLASECGRIILKSINSLSMQNTPSFSNVTFSLYHNGLIIFNAAFTIPGSATGKRFNATSGAILSTMGSGVNAIPGNSAGTNDNTSYYY
jgi:hypothetical protein